MNKFVFPLILLAAAFPKVSGNDISGNDDGGGVSSHIVKSRPMLRKRNNNVARELDEVIMAEKEANRDDTIPDVSCLFSIISYYVSLQLVPHNLTIILLRHPNNINSWRKRQLTTRMKKKTVSFVPVLMARNISDWK